MGYPYFITANLNQTLTTYESNQTTEESSTLLHPALFVLMWLNVLLTSGGNLLTIIAFVRDKNIYSKPANMLILNLAVADLKVGLVSLPLFNLWWHYGDWVFGEYLCKLWIIVDYAATVESMLAMLLISWDRHWMVHNIQSYVSNQTRRKATVMILTTWLLCYAYFAIVVLLWETVSGQHNINYNVDCDFPPNSSFKYTIFEVVAQFVIPVLGLCYFNTSMFYTIRKRVKDVKPTYLSLMFTTATATANRRNIAFHQFRGGREIGASTIQIDDDTHAFSNQQNKESSASVEKKLRFSRQRVKKDRKAAVTLTLLVVTYIICWAPYNVVIILETLSKTSVATPVSLFTEYLMWMNSAINPFLYVATNLQFRKQLKKMFCLSN